jgi:hypothetical protein
MEQSVAVYVLANETSDHARDLRKLWAGHVRSTSPLSALLKPVDLRGEAAAWGDLPHWTVLDVLTVHDVPGFIQAVQRLCRRSSRPTLCPGELMLGPCGNSLVVPYSSPDLLQLRLALIEATRDRIVRAPLTDEEFQRAAWWVRQVNHEVARNLAALEEVHRLYRARGTTPLPSAKSFRLGYLVQLVKQRSRGGAAPAAAQRALDHFLEYGEPSWYAPGEFLLHTTIVSGLEGSRSPESFSGELRQCLRGMLAPLQPDSLAVMGEDSERRVTVRVRDSLTETTIEEERCTLRVIASAPFAPPGAPVEPLLYPFRVFISYSHKDRDKAQQVVGILRRHGLEPLWDRDIQPGTPFTDAIKDQIASAHLFMPLVTKNSLQRPWVHEEIGYAIGIHIPVLPLALGDLPDAMAAQLQALPVREDLSDLAEQLTCRRLESLMAPPLSRPAAGPEVVDDPEKRTELMGRYANWLLGQGRYGLVRQRAPFSSFSIPVNPIHDPVWKQFKGSPNYHSLLREERLAFQQHAREKGCTLLLDPTRKGTGVDAHQRQTRLLTLREFLVSMPDDKVRVVVSESIRGGNLTTVGDWFVADAQVLSAGVNYRQTVFNSHAPTVLRRLRDIDREYEELAGLIAPGCSSREVAIKQIDEILRKETPG